MNVFSRILTFFVAPLLVVLGTLLPPSALAGDHGGGGAPEPMVFTVNLGKDNYLQFGLIFEGATPEVLHLLAGYKPRLQHEIILLLSGKEADKLRTLAGKKELIEEIIELGNHVIHEDEKTGIKEVLFTKFLIQ
jgi:flagellar FliL protein